MADHTLTKPGDPTLVPPAALVFVSVCFTVAGELLLKHGMNQHGTFDLEPTTLAQSLVQVFSNPAILVGFGLIFSAGLFWLSAISRMNLSVAYPMLSTSYILVLVASALFLGETVSLARAFGVGVIMVGVALVFRSQRSHS